MTMHSATTASLRSKKPRAICLPGLTISSTSLMADALAICSASFSEAYSLLAPKTLRRSQDQTVFLF